MILLKTEICRFSSKTEIDILFKLIWKTIYLFLRLQGGKQPKFNLLVPVLITVNLFIYFYKCVKWPKYLKLYNNKFAFKTRNLRDFQTFSTVSK